MSIDHPRIMRKLRPGALCGVLLLAAIGHAADAGAQGDRETRLLSSRPAPRRSCNIVPAPRPLPALAELADSVQLATDVAAFARQWSIGAEDSTTVLFSLAYGEGGRLERIAPIEYRLPQGQAEAFTELVRRSLRLQSRGGWSVRLRIRVGTAPAFRTGNSERCPPEGRFRLRLNTPAYASQQRPQPVRLRAWITPEGTVGIIDILGSSGNRDLDQLVRDALARHRFAPGLLDGVPVAMEHEQTVPIQARR
ncbi:MAG TPA: TonB family protein [Longimicrobiaceae bacterium]|nr:TonB family protein [Longimicrobiaceae bacterium]